ncbi:MAG: AraC family transcriptional regulator [Monoglobales bacterium]
MDNSGLSTFPFKVVSLTRVHGPLFEASGHDHEYFELVYLKRGTVDFETSEQTVSLSPHNIVIIKPHQLHKFTSASETCELFILSFTIDAADNLPPRIIEIADIISQLKQRPHIILAPGPKNAVLNVLKRTLWARQNRERWDDLLAYLLMLELLVYISREILSTSGFSGEKGINDAMMRAREYIKDNYEKNITLYDIANHIYLSESYFSHCFKARFGVSPKNYILQVRINAAKELLSSTDMKINEIALKVGFLSQQRFNDSFKRLENITPLKYRQNSRNLTADQSAEKEG